MFEVSDIIAEIVSISSVWERSEQNLTQERQKV